MVRCSYFNEDYLTDCTSEVTCKIYQNRFPLLFDEDNAAYYTK